MPSRAVHLAMDRFRFGCEFPEVHAELDSTFADGSYAHRRNTHFFEYVIDRLNSGHWTKEQCVAALCHMFDDMQTIMLSSDWATGEELISYARDSKEKEETNDSDGSA